MLGFLIKKTFYDLWDNLFRIVLLNFGFIISMAIPLAVPGYMPNLVLGMIVFALGFVWCFVFLSATALSVKKLSDYGSFGWGDFGANLKEGLSAGLMMALMGFLVFVVIRIVIPFYMGMESVIGLLLGMLLFWVLVLALTAFQFFFAVRARLNKEPKKIIKKCFIIFFDNPGFSIFCVLHIVAMLAITLFFRVPIMLLLPGTAGLLLFLDEALRLRLMKYDWLEANPPEPGSRKKQTIPWDVILIEDREKTGTRTFRNFIFPWRD